MIAPDWDYSDLQCPACGRNMRESSCWQCFGVGFFDLYEDLPLEYEPGASEACVECDGEGVLRWCPCRSLEGVTDD